MASLADDIQSGLRDQESYEIIDGTAPGYPRSKDIQSPVREQTERRLYRNRQRRKARKKAKKMRMSDARV